MKKNIIIIFLLLLSLGFSLRLPSTVSAQGMIGNMMGENNTIAENEDGHTAREEAEGKEIWEKLQAKEVACEDLSDDDFGALGEYFMGQMMGNSHGAMNKMMIQMMSEEGEKEMHVAMGKRMSGCEPDASMSQNMMGGGMVGGGGNSMMGSFATNPMSFFGGGFGWVFMILFWGLIILGIVVLVKWIANQGKSQTQEKSALDILKERYAKGEIDKKEFEEKKKDLRS